MFLTISWTLRSHFWHISPNMQLQKKNQKKPQKPRVHLAKWYICYESISTLWKNAVTTIWGDLFLKGCEFFVASSSQIMSLWTIAEMYASLQQIQTLEVILNALYNFMPCSGCRFKISSFTWTRIEAPGKPMRKSVRCKTSPPSSPTKKGKWQCESVEVGRQQ